MRVFAVTGDDVAGFELGQAAAEPLLRGVGARCLAVDPLDPNRVYVGTFDQGLYASDDGGRTWRQDERGLMIDSSKLANHTDISTEERR